MYWDILRRQGRIFLGVQVCYIDLSTSWETSSGLGLGLGLGLDMIPYLSPYLARVYRDIRRRQTEDHSVVTNWFGEGRDDDPSPLLGLWVHLKLKLQGFERDERHQIIPISSFSFSRELSWGTNDRAST